MSTDPIGPGVGWSRLQRIAGPLLLLVALLVAGRSALLVGRVDPPSNDILLHGHLAQAAAHALGRGWSWFQDPFVADLNGGYPLFRVYPHLSHQLVGLWAWLTGADAWQVMARALALGCLLTPLVHYLGARLLSLSAATAGVAALAAATLASTDGYGHVPLAYDFAGHGLFAQQWGMLLAGLALPAWVAAARHRERRPLFFAAALVSLVLRTHLPSFWILALLAPLVAALHGPRQRLPRRLFRAGLVGLGAALLAGGFLYGFIGGLSAVGEGLVRPEKLASIGARAVLRGLRAGAWLDGTGLGLWTLLWLCGVLLGAGLGLDRLRRALRRSAAAHADRDRGLPERDSAGLALALTSLVALALFFGRATWGDWVTQLPIVGRFHDHRYLLGVQLLAPWLCGWTLLSILRGARRLAPAQTRRTLTIGLVALASLLCGLRAQQQWSEVGARQAGLAQALPSFEQSAARFGPLLSDLSVMGPDTPLAALYPDPVVGGIDTATWLTRHDLPTVGLSRHHYNLSRDFSRFWAGWLRDPRIGRQQPVDEADLVAIGGARLLLPPGLSSDQARLPEHTLPSGWRLLGPDRPPVHLVRSDLLLRSFEPDLRALPIAWFRTGLHRARQFPAVVPEDAPRPAGTWFREQDVRDRDHDAFRPHASWSEAELGTLHSVEGSARDGGFEVRLDVATEGAVALFGVGYHPGWAAELNGAPVETLLLLPGLVGVRLPAGPDQHLRLFWPVPRWRGPVGALSTVLTLIGLALFTRILRGPLVPRFSLLRAPAAPLRPDEAGSAPWQHSLLGLAIILLAAGTAVLGLRRAETTPEALRRPGPRTVPRDPVLLPGVDGLPPLMVDRTEVSVARWAECVEAGACPAPPAEWNRDPALPVRGIRWSEARAYCRWRGARLPTGAEWSRAAGSAPFPWGSAPPSCDRAVFRVAEQDGCGLDSPAPVGALAAGASPEGALDLVGNLWEWTLDGYDRTGTPTDAPDAPYRGTRGGSFVSSVARLDPTLEEFTMPDDRDLAIGVRCVFDLEEPAGQEPRP